MVEDNPWGVQKLFRSYSGCNQLGQNKLKPFIPTKKIDLSWISHCLFLLKGGSSSPQSPSATNIGLCDSWGSFWFFCNILGCLHYSMKHLLNIKIMSDSDFWISVNFIIEQGKLMNTTESLRSFFSLEEHSRVRTVSW